MQVIENVKLKGVMKVKIQFYGFEERSILFMYSIP